MAAKAGDRNKIKPFFLTPAPVCVSQLVTTREAELQLDADVRSSWLQENAVKAGPAGNAASAGQQIEMSGSVSSSLHEPYP